MKNKWFKKLLVVGAVATMLFSTSVPAFAYVDESAVLEEEFTGEEVQVEGTAEATSENTETTGDAFSVEGNGSVLDDVVDAASSKEFYTIQTANNNTYFLVIDNSSTTQNVYMLSMIDENDLKEFLDEETEEETTVTQPTVVIEEEKTTEADTEETEAAEVENVETSGKTKQVGTLAILALLGAGVAGGYYYLKFYKPKKDGAFSDDEDLEYLDDGETINEDEREIEYDEEDPDDEDGYYLDDDEE